MMVWRVLRWGSLAVGVSLGLAGCLVERTVTDGSGNLIYQEPAVVTPFESTQEQIGEVEKKERELGWQ